LIDPLTASSKRWLSGLEPVGKRLAAVTSPRPTRETTFSPMAFHWVPNSLDAMLSCNSRLIGPEPFSEAFRERRLGIPPVSGSSGVYA
jgi:hypothetical protein